jgi:hypothetical protein
MIFSFFLEAKSTYIEVLKWILISFENLLGLKIHFDKCKMVRLNIFSTEGANFSFILGYKLSQLPTIYLGVPLHFKKLRVEY